MIPDELSTRLEKLYRSVQKMLSSAEKLMEVTESVLERQALLEQQQAGRTQGLSFADACQLLELEVPFTSSELSVAYLRRMAACDPARLPAAASEIKQFATDLRRRITAARDLLSSTGGQIN